MYNIIDLPNRIRIGLSGTDGQKEVEIDIAAWVALYPDALFDVFFQRPGESGEQGYFTDTEQDGTVLRWRVSFGDTAIDGIGHMEIHALRGGEDPVYAKSKRVEVEIRESIAGSDYFRPKGSEPWTARVEAAATAVRTFHIPRAYDVRDYGAVEGDETSDLVEAINAIIERNAEEPGVICIPSGTWYAVLGNNADCVMVPSGWQIMGAGMHSTTIECHKGNNAGTVFMIIGEDGDPARNVLMRDFWLTVTNTGAPGHDIGVQPAGIGTMDGIGISKARNVVIERVGFEVEWKPITVQGYDVDGVAIRDCDFLNSGFGSITIENDGAGTLITNILVENCEFRHNEIAKYIWNARTGDEWPNHGEIWIYADDYARTNGITIRDCRFGAFERYGDNTKDPNNTKHGNAVYGTYCNNILFENCTFDDINVRFSYSKGTAFEKCRMDLYLIRFQNAAENIRFEDSEISIGLSITIPDAAKNVSVKGCTVTGVSLPTTQYTNVEETTGTFAGTLRLLANGEVYAPLTSVGTGIAYADTKTSSLARLRLYKQGEHYRLIGALHTTNSLSASSEVICTLPFEVTGKGFLPVTVIGSGLTTAESGFVYLDGSKIKARTGNTIAANSYIVFDNAVGVAVHPVETNGGED